MAEKSTFFKFDRNITSWRWYKNANTMRLFIHLLLAANIKDAPFEKTIIHRGQLATSYERLSEQLDFSLKECRTGVEHLKETGEISVKRYSKFICITINNYDAYQSDYKPYQPTKTKRNTVKKDSFIQTGVAPNGEPYTEIDGMWYNKDGKRINDLGFEILA